MITVPLGGRSYPIHVTDSYRQLPRWLAARLTQRDAVVVSHAEILRRDGRRLLEPLRRAGWRLTVVTVPESERSKSLLMVERVVRQLTAASAMRVPVLLAFGGGVVGDLTGFVAAVFRRGVPYVQVPTTLLAQVDSAIGGKVAVDVPQAKNMVGAFYQPRLVCNNLSVLRTLPPRQRRSGMAEVIKYGVIADPSLFGYLEQHMAACLALEPRAVRVMVERSCRVKARVVGRDERETRGVRAQLNFGHTIGHALEAATGYRRWTHGEAIAIGMCAAARMAQREGMCTEATARRIIALVRAAGLPTHAGRMNAALVHRLLRYDKKFITGRPRWVLPTAIGRVVVTERVSPATIVWGVRRALNGERASG